ncbi:hypothetical protein H4R33_003974 [Dimargaris cristalligena]|nr:hypothetical protein H4R33_003974 [Dimargaris cristalligena]
MHWHCPPQDRLFYESASASCIAHWNTVMEEQLWRSQLLQPTLSPHNYPASARTSSDVPIRSTRRYLSLCSRLFPTLVVRFPSLVKGSLLATLVGSIIGVRLFWDRRLPALSTPVPPRQWLTMVGSGLAGLSLLGLQGRWFQEQMQRALQQELTRLITACQIWDAQATRLLKTIQEIELVARGYRLLTPLPPVSRIELRGSRKQGLSLRQGLRSAIDQQYKEWQAHPLLSTMDTLDESYGATGQTNIDELDMPPVAFSGEENPAADPLTIQCLKDDLQNLYQYRRIWLLDLIVAHRASSSNSCRDMVQRVKAILQVVDVTVQNVKRIHQLGIEPDASGLAKTCPTDEKHPLLEHLSALNHTLRSIQAKIYLSTQEAHVSGQIHDGLDQPAPCPESDSPRSENDVDESSPFTHDCLPVPDDDQGGIEQVFEAVAEKDDASIGRSSELSSSASDEK